MVMKQVSKGDVLHIDIMANTGIHVENSLSVLLLCLLMRPRLSFNLGEPQCSTPDFYLPLLPPFSTSLLVPHTVEWGTPAKSQVESIMAGEAAC